MDDRGGGSGLALDSIRSKDVTKYSFPYDLPLTLTPEGEAAGSLSHQRKLLQRGDDRGRNAFNRPLGKDRRCPFRGRLFTEYHCRRNSEPLGFLRDGGASDCIMDRRVGKDTQV
jgi:hypothetical protein